MKCIFCKTTDRLLAVPDIGYDRKTDKFSVTGLLESPICPDCLDDWLIDTFPLERDEIRQIEQMTRKLVTDKAASRG